MATTSPLFKALGKMTYAARLGDCGRFGGCGPFGGRFSGCFPFLFSWVLEKPIALLNSVNIVDRAWNLKVEDGESLVKNIYALLIVIPLVWPSRPSGSSTTSFGLKVGSMCMSWWAVRLKKYPKIGQFFYTSNKFRIFVLNNIRDHTYFDVT